MSAYGENYYERRARERAEEARQQAEQRAREARELAARAEREAAAKRAEEKRQAEQAARDLANRMRVGRETPVSETGIQQSPFEWQTVGKCERIIGNKTITIVAEVKFAMDDTRSNDAYRLTTTEVTRVSLWGNEFKTEKNTQTFDWLAELNWKRAWKSETQTLLARR